MVEVCAYNLGTGATKYGHVSSLEDIKKLEESVNPNNYNDVEIQLIQSEFNIGTDVIEFFRILKKI